MDGSEHSYIFCAIPLIFFGLLIAFVFACQRSRCLFTEKESDEEEAMNAVSGPEQIYPKDKCPICLSNICYAVTTGCGHLFCGMCYKRYSEEQNDSCPVCRQTVEKIYVHFTDEEKASEEDIGQEVTEFVNDYNKKMILLKETFFHYLTMQN